MSLKSWFGFPISPENLTPTAEFICICFTALSVIFGSVVAVAYKCTQKKNRGKKEDKTAERNSTKALSSGETENESKHSKVVAAEDQIDGRLEKQEEVKEEVKTEPANVNMIKTTKAKKNEAQTKDINTDVQQLHSEKQAKTLNKDLKQDSPELELSKSDEQLKETRPEPEIQSSEVSTPKVEKSDGLQHDTLIKVKKTPSGLKLALALTRMVKLEDEVDTFCSGNNQPMENNLENLKRQLRAKEKELEKYEWLRNELIHGIKSLPQLKLTLAITRIQKLEETVDELLHVKNQSVENNLQILQCKLEAKEKEAKEEMAKTQQQLQDEQRRREDAELTVQKRLESTNELEDRMAQLERQLQDEQRRREDAELTVQKRLESTNELEDKVAELRRQLQGERRKREDAEKDLKNLNVLLATKNRKSALSSGLGDLLKDIDTICAEMVMKENDLQRLKKELETINKGPSADHETRSQTIDELKQTQTRLEERNTEIRKLRKQLDHKLNEEKQRNEQNLETLKKTFETQKQKFEDKVCEVQQQLKDEQQRRDALMELNQKFQRQLGELKERHKDELQDKIQVEQQWRKEVEGEVEVLKQELESKTNQLKTAEEEEPDISADEPSAPTEPNEALDSV